MVEDVQESSRTGADEYYSGMNAADPDTAAFPACRLQFATDRPARTKGEYVVYWMTTSRRVEWNFALQRAGDWAAQLQRPLVVVEVLACGGRWDCERFHRFTLDGMADNARQLADRPVLYYPYVEARPGEARALFHALSRRACLVVTDDYPLSLPALQTVDTRAAGADGVYRGDRRQRAAADAGRRPGLFDSAGLSPFHASDDPRAPLRLPTAEPLGAAAVSPAGMLAAEIARRWPAGTHIALGGFDLAALPIDHRIGPVELQGGPVAAGKVWRNFLATKLARYRDRNQPEADGSSGLSPYLHLGHISVHEIFRI